MIAKEIILGFFIGIIANIMGMVFYILLFSEHGLETTIYDGIEKGYIGGLIALGAILNFFPFFVFLKKNQYYRARGVILASLVAAIIIAVSKFL